MEANSVTQTSPFLHRDQLRALVAFFVSSLLAGLAAIAIMPPFEGYDEIAHFSRVQEIADRGKEVSYPNARISRSVESYPGPMPYGIEVGTQHYGSFRHVAGVTRLGAPSPFVEGVRPNWQQQHPPLLYQLLARIYPAHANSWVGAFFILRVACWTFAMTGLAIAVLGAQSTGERFALAAMPLLIPEFLPEMARIGNDSLCLLVAAFCWIAIVRLGSSQKLAWACLLGTALGLGLLTKALFVPVAVASLLALGALAVQRRELKLLGLTAIVAIIALVIGGNWYIESIKVSGDLIRSDEFVRFKQLGGPSLLSRLAHAPVLQQAPWAVATIVISFFWGGTWSLAEPHVAFIPFAAAMSLIPMLRWLSMFRRWRFADGTAAIWLATILAGMLWHSVQFIAYTAKGASTPGHYLLIATPAIGFAVGRGWRLDRWQALALVAGAVFTIGIWAEQLALYSGCATRDEPHHHYAFSGSCFIDSTMLSALGNPWLGTILATLSIAALITGAIVSKPRIDGENDGELEPFSPF